MGVTGLWTVVQPCARPIKLETLNKKRLAVDASIWIYQFLKAVRDKEGNALRNSHVVGFFRRICKLLYFGIKPVFVFDGGAPVLKRQTIAGRRKRREGHREDAVRTAGKLLAVQVQRTAEEESAKQRRRRRHEEEEVPDEPVYAEETFMSDKEKRQRHFRKKDAYHLPDLQVSMDQMGAPNDPRVMSREELEEYARQFHQGEDVNLYDFSKIDFDSPFFISLPATDRYNILNAARLRSRLRMGYSKEQLDIMFPDRMAFSKFQIERVKERNDLTQRLMNINGMNSDDAWYGMNQGQRIAGERGKEYVLVKDSNMEGGWVLGVVGNKNEGQADKPIDVDRYGQPEIYLDNEEPSDDDGAFEDVPVEGLNRLPKLPLLQGVSEDASAGLQGTEDDSLFVEDENLHDPAIAQFLEDRGSDDEDLQRAIAMSLESTEGRQDNELPEIPVNREIAPPAPPEFVPHIPSESEDEGMDFGAALAQSKPTRKEPRAVHPYDGPLPFESMKLHEPRPRLTEEPARKDAGQPERMPMKQPKQAESLPPWFSAEHSNAEFVPDKVDDNSLDRYRERTMTPGYQFLKDHRSPAVIDADKADTNEVIDVDAPDGEDVGIPSKEDQGIETAEAPPRKEQDELVTGKPQPEIHELANKMELEEARDEAAQDRVIQPHEASVDEQDHTRAEPSPTPEFEDVAIEQEKAPDGLTGLDTQVTTGVDANEEFEGEEVVDPEEEDLMRQLAEEGEEHARFAATLNSAPQPQEAVDYETELKQLRSQQQRDRRDADEVTQIMINECQQLLRLFGLPYITAPMEAEAQCAEMVSLGLVDGIITDDSDIFLFGGTRVYKNMFNQSKFVECYLTSDMEKEYALHRQKLISFAHLLGSDYTEGIPGIGPVTALEILTEFSGLEEFREWWTQVQTGLSIPDDTHGAFQKKFKKNISKLFLPPSFPDVRVDTAYLEPEVDSDPSMFQWGVPDLHGLRNYLMATIGWSQERTDEVLVPVIRDMNRREQEGTQSNITSFFNGPQGAGAFAPRVRSSGKSRMDKAFSRLRQEAGAEDTAQDEPDGVAAEDVGSEDRPSESRGKGKGKKRKTAKGTAADNSTGDGGKGKKRKTRGKASS